MEHSTVNPHNSNKHISSSAFNIANEIIMQSSVTDDKPDDETESGVQDADSPNDNDSPTTNNDDASSKTGEDPEVNSTKKIDSPPTGETEESPTRKQADPESTTETTTTAAAAAAAPASSVGASPLAAALDATITSSKPAPLAAAVTSNNDAPTSSSAADTTTKTKEEPPEDPYPTFGRSHSSNSFQKYGNSSGGSSVSANDPPEQNLHQAFATPARISNWSSNNARVNARARSQIMANSIHNINKNARGHVYLDGEDSVENMSVMSGVSGGSKASGFNSAAVSAASSGPRAKQVEPHHNVNRRNQEPDVGMDERNKKVGTLRRAKPEPPSGPSALDKHLSRTAKNSSSSQLNVVEDSVMPTATSKKKFQQRGDDPSVHSSSSKHSRKSYNASGASTSGVSTTFSYNASGSVTAQDSQQHLFGNASTSIDGNHRQRKNVRSKSPSNLRRRSKSPGADRQGGAHNNSNGGGFWGKNKKDKNSDTEAMVGGNQTANRVKFADQTFANKQSSPSQQQQPQPQQPRKSWSDRRISSSNSSVVSDVSKSSIDGPINKTRSRSKSPSSIRSGNRDLSNPQCSPSSSSVISGYSTTPSYTSGYAATAAKSYYGKNTNKTSNNNKDGNKSIQSFLDRKLHQYNYLKKNAALLAAIAGCFFMCTMVLFGVGGDSSGGIDKEQNLRGLKDGDNNMRPPTRGIMDNVSNGSPFIPGGPMQLNVNVDGGAYMANGQQLQQQQQDPGEVDWSKIPPHLRGYYSKMMGGGSPQQQQQQQAPPPGGPEGSPEQQQQQAQLDAQAMAIQNLGNEAIGQDQPGGGGFVVPGIDQEEFARQQFEKEKNERLESLKQQEQQQQEQQMGQPPQEGEVQPALPPPEGGEGEPQQGPFPPPPQEALLGEPPANSPDLTPEEEALANQQMQDKFEEAREHQKAEAEAAAEAQALRQQQEMQAKALVMEQQADLAAAAEASDSQDSQQQQMEAPSDPEVDAARLRAAAESQELEEARQRAVEEAQRVEEEARQRAAQEAQRIAEEEEARQQAAEEQALASAATAEEDARLARVQEIKNALKAKEMEEQQQKEEEEEAEEERKKEARRQQQRKKEREEQMKMEQEGGGGDGEEAGGDGGGGGKGADAIGELQNELADLMNILEQKEKK